MSLSKEAATNEAEADTDCARAIENNDRADRTSPKDHSAKTCLLKEAATNEAPGGFDPARGILHAVTPLLCPAELGGRHRGHNETQAGSVSAQGVNMTTPGVAGTPPPGGDGEFVPKFVPKFVPEFVPAIPLTFSSTKLQMKESFPPLSLVPNTTHTPKETSREMFTGMGKRGEAEAEIDGQTYDSTTQLPQDAAHNLERSISVNNGRSIMLRFGSRQASHNYAGNCVEG